MRHARAPHVLTHTRHATPGLYPRPQACAKGVKIGKILIQREGDTGPCRIIYEKVPLDIDRRYVLLLDPILASGAHTQSVNAKRKHVQCSLARAC
jgi:uracil phosphoribosyltransferase